MRLLAVIGFGILAGCGGGAQVQPVTLTDAANMLDEYCHSAWEAKTAVTNLDRDVAEAKQATAGAWLRGAANVPENHGTVVMAINDKLRAMEARTERLTQKRNSIVIQGRALTPDEQDELETIGRELEYLANSQRCVVELKAQLER